MKERDPQPLNALSSKDFKSIYIKDFKGQKSFRGSTITWSGNTLIRLPSPEWRPVGHAVLR